jgi:3-oxoacyl-[acyl-carrier protein] reductase
MPQYYSRLKDKVVIVTGGAQGIGRAYVLGMADEGAKVVIADINLQAAEATLKEVQAKGYEAMAIKADVSSVEETEAMAKKTVEHFGRIDVLVNNAGMHARVSFGMGPFWEIDTDEWDKVMKVNLKGTFLCARAVFPYMKAQGGGKIINISSGVVYFGAANLMHYATSKAGIIGMTRSMAREAGDYNIKVNCIAPGATQSYAPDEKEPYEERQKVLEMFLPKRILKRVETAEDCVGAAIFFASSDSDFITGQTLIVDGGEVMN